MAAVCSRISLFMSALISGHCLSESSDMISEALTSPETVPGVTEYAFHRCVQGKLVRVRGDAPLGKSVRPSRFWRVRDASRHVSENPVFKVIQYFMFTSAFMFVFAGSFQIMLPLCNLVIQCTAFSGFLL